MKRKLAAVLLIWCAMLFFWLVAEAFFLCPTRLRVAEYRIALPGWPADGAEARVVVLSDLHAAANQEEWVRKIVRQTIDLQPELVLLLGDYVAAPLGLSNMPEHRLAALLAPLARHCPVMYVCGNHDAPFVRTPDIRPFFEKAGFLCIEALPARGVTFRNGRRADFKGSPMPYTYHDICRHYSTKREPRSVPLIAVQHDPYHFLTRPLWADLVLCGHTHGGQFCLPGGQPMVSIKKWTPALLRAGLRRAVSGQPVIISRGLGESTLPARTFCPPEIVLLRLVGGDAGPRCTFGNKKEGGEE